MNATQAAIRAGYSRKTVIYDIEHGKETVQFRSLARVLEALNISLSLDSPLMPAYYQERHATG